MISLKMDKAINNDVHWPFLQQATYFSISTTECSNYLRK